MSRKNLYDNILEFSGNADEYVNTEMDIPSDFHNSELMSSEFFDSVMSLEQPNFMTNFDSDILGNIDDDLCLSNASSSHADDVQSTNSFSSEGEKSGGNEQTMDDDLIMSLFSTQTVQSKKLSQNANAKKVILTKPFTNSVKKNNLKNKPQLLRVQSGNGRSLLLPFNIANVKSIKILNASDLKATTSVPVQQERYSISSNETLEEDEDVQYPALNLTTEEKRLLAKDGVQLPTRYPLTKNEERELKRIRRKIRNKISAQDSRKRKKEYVDGLEERVKRGSEENKFLLKRVKQLQQQNSTLMSQMSKLQSLVLSTSASKAAPATCLMIVLFSALLVSLPNLGFSSSKEVGDQQQVAARRALLFSQQATNEDEALNMDEFLLFKDEEELEGVLEEDEESVNKTEKAALVNLLNEITHKYNIPADKINCSGKLGGIDKLSEYCNKYEKEIKSIIENMKDFFGGGNEEDGNSKIDYGVKDKNGFIEPDIDDYVGGKRKFVEVEGFEAKKIKLDELKNSYESKKE